MSSAGVAASSTRTAGLAACRLTTPTDATDGRRNNDDLSATEVTGRQVWDDHRRQSRQSSPSDITRGVAKMNVRGDDMLVDCAGGAGEDCTADDGDNDNGEDDDGEMESGKMAGSGGGRNESVASEGCGDGQDDDQGSTRDSTFSGGSAGGGGERKNVRQPTFDAIADIMDKHRKMMATTGDSASKRQCSVLTRQCDILEREVEVQKEHYEKADQANLMMCNSLLEIAKAIRERSRRLSVTRLRGVGGMPFRAPVRSSCAPTFNVGPIEGCPPLGGENGLHTVIEGAGFRQVVVGGATGTSPRIHKAQGIVINEALVQRQVAVVGEAMASGVRTPIVLVVGGGRLDKAVIGAVQPRQALPAQQAGGSSAAITPPPQKKVDLGGNRTTSGDHQTFASGVAEGVVEGRVDDVRHKDGKRDGRQEDDDDDDRPLASRRKRTAEEVNLEERSKLWVDCDTFWG
ncbi:hypothetical protein CBR_g38163 [Chara braunii]|uniref:Uncharacterized protein n=1 Tax=Chara braunii TaxID=69332 RepID=A0A388LPQ6_CHABU|nr:hypothetical protein CBR_g38163 [Chara braunii]|eukprot:GBG84192.1 hypothetical protein CBR_g38163 [Chara braunii]